MRIEFRFCHIQMITGKNCMVQLHWCFFPLRLRVALVYVAVHFCTLFDFFFCRRISEYYQHFNSIVRLHFISEIPIYPKWQIRVHKQNETSPKLWLTSSTLCQCIWIPKLREYINTRSRKKKKKHKNKNELKLNTKTGIFFVNKRNTHLSQSIEKAVGDKEPIA